MTAAPIAEPDGENNKVKLKREKESGEKEEFKRTFVRLQLFDHKHK